MSDKDKKQDIEQKIDESRKNQVNNNDSEEFSRNITKMQSPDEWPDPPTEESTNEKE